MISLAEVNQIIEKSPAKDNLEWMAWAYLVDAAVRELDIELATWWAELEYAKL